MGRKRSSDDIENIRIAQHRKTAPLRKQIEALSWAITHEPNVAKADALRKQLKPLQNKLTHRTQRYIDSSVARELVA